MHKPLPSDSLRRTSAYPRRVAGLTGLRALAVLAVLAYHLFPDAVPGGFIGVDVFFVVSGFIVTRLLLIEREQRGRVSFRAFWARRARRILPALTVVLVVCIPLAFAVDARLLTDIRRQLLGAMTFSSNWAAVAADGDYFHAERPDLFTNLWSLAVEEQFYLLGPVLLVAALVLLRIRSRTVMLSAVGLAALSAIAMGVLASVPGSTATRAYFGTDTHAFGLLLGVALAVGFGAGRLPAMVGRQAARGTVVGTVSLGVLVTIALLMSSASAFTTHGGLVLASVAAVGLVWAAATVPAVGRILDSTPPLRWLGERSYAIYLWHWPLLLILGATPLKSVPLLLALLTAALSIGAAALSFVFVESPFLRKIPRERPAARRRRLAPIAIFGILAVGSATIAVVHEDASAAQAAVARGRAALSTASPAPTSAPAPTAAPSTSPPTASPEPPAPAPIVGTDITAVGDSVMLAAAPELQNALPGIAIDAEVSRSMWVAPDILSSLAGTGSLRPIVVLGLATNGEVGVDLLNRVLTIIGPDRTLVLVNGHADRSWIPGVNSALAAFADAHTGTVIADWDGAISPRPDELADDGIHPQPAGGAAYAAALNAAIVAGRAETEDAPARKATP